MDLSTMRREFESHGLEQTDLHTNPVQQFELWFEAARSGGILEPNAMSLATVNAEGRPHLRTVLLKYFDNDGFVFFTNYRSRKAQDLEHNPHATLLFPWVALNRQVCIEGVTEKVTKAESLKYFASRPRESQIGAWVSDQSQVIRSRGLLEQKLAEAKARFQQGEIPLPGFWGGYRVRPTRLEFWQGRPHRLHDRFEYTHADAGWEIRRLQP